jgi:hypothetical protein
MGYLSYNITAALQFAFTITFVGIVYRKLVVQTYQEMLAAIKKK